MTKKSLLLGLAAAVAIAAGAYGVYRLGMSRGMQMTATLPAASPAAAAQKA